MDSETRLSRGERLALVALAIVGGAGLNGVFLYVVFARPDLLERALGDPIAWALMIEALLVTGLLAWTFVRLRGSRLAWGWFVVLSLAGGLAFGIPVALLVGDRRTAPRA
jgi:hypothetical protein